jgi:hypothetical protein
MNSLKKIGFTYAVQHIRDGVVLSEEVCHNMVPTAGLNYALDVLVKNATGYPSWYIGLYEGNYVPVANVTMATLPTDCAETTAYSELTRVAFTPGTIANGVVDNSASKAEFTFTSGKTIYGGFMSSSSGKSSATGLALSVVRFQNPKVVSSGDVLRVTSGLTLSSI